MHGDGLYETIELPVYQNSTRPRTQLCCNPENKDTVILRIYAKNTLTALSASIIARYLN